LLRWHGQALETGLGMSPCSKVVLGKNGWLYYAGEKSVECFRATEPFTEEELAAWDRLLTERQDWLARRGCRYLFCVAPDKETIYPEFVPARLNRVGRRTRLDQLIAYVGTHSRVPILDLREPLTAAKGDGPLYFKEDTHWNLHGAAIGYRAIVAALADWFPELRPLEFRSAGAFAFTGDLRQMIGVDGPLAEDRWLPAKPMTAAPTEEGMPAGAIRRLMPGRWHAMKGGRGRMRAVVFHDSFVNSMIEPLAEHFERIVFLWQYPMEATLIERERPQVVIQEMVERALMGPVPRDDLRTEK
jgi:hypothetical protein